MSDIDYGENILYVMHQSLLLAEANFPTLTLAAWVVTRDQVNATAAARNMEAGGEGDALVVMGVPCLVMSKDRFLSSHPLRVDLRTMARQ